MTAVMRSTGTKALRKDESGSTVESDRAQAQSEGSDSAPGATMSATASTTTTKATDGATTGSNNNGGASTRMDRTTVCLPIVYGSVAFFLGKKADEYHTHRWTLYLRGPNNEDLSVSIAKVVFQLHPSFAQPVRELTSPPFEVTETGWGEFEAQIRIIWKDQGEKATLMTHGIKLYPPGVPQAPPTDTTEPVIDEHYDEVVFTDPNETFYRQLMRTSIAPRVESANPNLQALFKGYSDEDDFQKLIEAQNFLSKELRTVKERMKLATDEFNQVEDALRQAQEVKKAAASSSSTSSRTSGKTKSSSSGGNASKKTKTKA